MTNSIRLIFLSVALFLTFGIFAQATTPPFSDNEQPIFSNTYLIDNVSNNSVGGDLTLRINKKAPFDCKTKEDCPASVIISNANGNVNMPVDVNVRSLYVGKALTIDSTGRWVGPSSGLRGDKGDTGPQGPMGLQGPKGDAGPIGPAGPQGLKGDTGATGATGPQGPQGFKGDTGATGPAGPQGLKGDTGATGPAGPQGPKGDIGPAGPQGIQGFKGDTGAMGPPGPQGLKGDTGPAGAQGIKGDKGDPGDGCWYDDQSQRINCAGGTWIPLSSIKGPQGDRGASGPTGPTGATGPMGPTGPAGATGPAGPTGPQGPAGFRECRTVTADVGPDSAGGTNPQTLFIFADCNTVAKPSILTGGSCFASSGRPLLMNMPTIDITPNPGTGKPLFNRWQCRGESTNNTTGRLTATAICCSN
jgi:hypothetical protein